MYLGAYILPDIGQLATSWDDIFGGPILWANRMGDGKLIDI